MRPQRHDTFLTFFLYKSKHRVTVRWTLIWTVLCSLRPQISNLIVKNECYIALSFTIKWISIVISKPWGAKKPVYWRVWRKIKLSYCTDCTVKTAIVTLLQHQLDWFTTLTLIIDRTCRRWKKKAFQQYNVYFNKAIGFHTGGRVGWVTVWP